jgi:PAS domain S-box-containing protein
MKKTKKSTPIIMIVDDIPDNLNLLSETLKNCGYSVRPAPNGKLALKAIQEEKPDLILLDIMMPEMDGFEVCSKLKEDKNTKDIPVIFLTAMGHKDDEEKGLSIGAVDYITKPLNIPLVKARINTHLQLKFHRDHLEQLVKERTDKLLQVNKELIAEIKERKRMEEKILESEKKFHSIFENSMDAILLTQENGIILDANRSACTLFKKTKEELCKSDRSGIVDMSDPNLQKLLEERQKTGKAIGDLTFIKNDGTVFKGEISSSFIDNNGTLRKTCMIIRDITDRIKYEESIIKSRNFYLSLFEEMPAMIWQSDTNMKFNYFNKSWLNFTNHSLEEEINSQLKNSIHSEYFDIFFNTYKSAFKEKCSFSVQLKLLKNNNSYNWVIIYGRPYNNLEGKFSGFIGNCFDINDIEISHEKIRLSLIEKDVLLKEIHHRVKNNLQIISSLLFFEEQQLKDKYLKGRINNYRARLKSMAIVHENLYKYNRFSEVDINIYVHDLCAFLSQNYDLSKKEITFEQNINDIYLDISIAVPIGLLMNEIITNSLIHAFPEGKSGKISISLDHAEGLNYHLSIHDDGVGLPEDFDITKIESLGFRLIKILIKQIAATIKIESDKGTKIDIMFQIK